MKAHPEPIDPENDRYLVEMANRAAIVVAAWGAEGAYLDRGEAVKRIIPNLHCLGLTKDGHPKHPLYLRKDLEPIIMERAEMNNTDRKRLKRIYNCLAIPGCFAGPSMTQSMSIEGATGYAYDTSYALPKARELLSIIGLEAWHAKRVAEDWKHPGKVTKQTTEATHEKS